MSSNLPIIGFVPSTNLDRALPFYTDMLGLEFVERNSFSLVFRSECWTVRVVAVNDLKPQPFTILGWETPSIERTVRSLAEKGLNFIQYPSFEQDELDIWTTPDGARVAWFNDPDGNVLSFTQSAGS